VGVVESEASKVARVKATLSDKNSFTEQIKALDALIGSGHADIIKNALDAYAALFDCFYDDAERRSQVEEKIKTGLGNLPVLFQINLLLTLAKSALDHADPGQTLQLVNEAQTTTDGHQWPPRYGIPLECRSPHKHLGVKQLRACCAVEEIVSPFPPSPPLSARHRLGWFGAQLGDPFACAPSSVDSSM